MTTAREILDKEIKEIFVLLKKNNRPPEKDIEIISNIIEINHMISKLWLEKCLEIPGADDFFPTLVELIYRNKSYEKEDLENLKGLLVSHGSNGLLHRVFAGTTIFLEAAITYCKETDSIELENQQKKEAKMQGFLEFLKGKQVMETVNERSAFDLADRLNSIRYEIKNRNAREVISN